MNVVYITADSLRFDYISYFNPDSPSSTPNIDALAEAGLAFERAYANGPYTTLSVPSMLTGEYQPAITDDTPTVAEIMRDAGYATGGFCTNVQIVGNKLRGLALWRGFDEFDTMLSTVRQRSEVKIEKAAGFAGSAVERVFGSESVPFRAFLSVFPYLPLPMTVPTPHAEAVNERIVEWLNQEEWTEPFFVWAFNLDTHEPWMPPIERDDGLFDRVRRHGLNRKYRYFDSAITHSEGDRIRELYAQSVEYWDRQIGHLVETISERTDEQTVFVITSDHGELLGEHGMFGHRGGPEEELLHVPLVVSGGDIESADVDALVENMDVVRTIADLAGTEVPPTVRGQSLLDPDALSSNRQGVLSLLSREPLSLAYRTDDWQYVRTPDGDRLYDAANSTREDLADSEPTIVKRLADAADAVLKDVSFDVERPDEASVDAEIQDRLHSLGYLE